MAKVYPIQATIRRTQATAIKAEACIVARARIPTVIYGPGNIDQAHTLNEYITLDQLDIGVNHFRMLIRRICL